MLYELFIPIFGKKMFRHEIGIRLNLCCTEHVKVTVLCKDENLVHIIWTILISETVLQFARTEPQPVRNFYPLGSSTLFFHPYRPTTDIDLPVSRSIKVNYTTNCKL